MQFVRSIRSLATSPLRNLLDLPDIRRRLIFDLKQRYYDELDILVPLGHELIAPICSQDSWFSFSEIFLQSEYQNSLDNILSHGGMPAKWLDIGCHAGYFSLWLTYQHKIRKNAADCQALLVDADPRVAKAITKMIQTNQLTDMKFAHGLIANQKGAIPFAVRDCMASSKAELGELSENVQLIRTLDQDDLIGLLPPPYDLVKIDIEGGEYDFLTAYEKILDTTRYLILEWHSWHSGGGGRGQLEQLLDKRRFHLIAKPAPARAVMVHGRQETCGLLVLANKNAI